MEHLVYTDIRTDFLEADRDYSNFVELNSGYNASCSGVGDCYHCNKLFYPLRTVYLKAYIRLYRHDKHVCPRLYWVHANTAKFYIAGEFHSSKCDIGEKVENCSCDLADFLRTAFGATEDTRLASLGDQIYPNFKKLIK